MSLPRYPEYKDSGVEWLGAIPSNWTTDRLKRRCHVFPSNVDKKSVDGERAVRLCNYTDVYYNDRIVPDMSLMDATATDQQIAKFTLRAGDTVFTKDSESADDIGVAAYVPSDLPGIVCGYHLSIARPIVGTNGAYVKWLFDARYTKARFAVLANGLTRVGLNQYAVDNMELPWPPFEEQVAIASFLDRETAKIDALIAEQEKLLALLAEKRQATISHAVTRGLDPNAPMKDPGIPWLGEVPAHWEVRSLKSIVATPITDGPHETPTFLDEGVPFVSAEAVSGGTINFDKIRGYISAEDNARYSQKYRPQLHDIYMVKSGATTGVTAIVDGRTDFNIWSPLAAIRCSQTIANPYFILGYLRSRNFQEGVALNWSFGTQQNIGMGVLGDLPVALPPRDEQREISRFLEDQLRALSTLQLSAEQAVPLLRGRRNELVAAAVTGQNDVRGLVEAQAA